MVGNWQATSSLLAYRVGDWRCDLSQRCGGNLLGEEMGRGMGIDLVAPGKGFRWLNGNGVYGSMEGVCGAGERAPVFGNDCGRLGETRSEDGIFVDIRVGGRAEKEKGVNKRCDAVRVDLWRPTLEEDTEEEDDDDDSSDEGGSMVDGGEDRSSSDGGGLRTRPT
ncbi:hypothetical protein CKAH01_01864 [Colletotrichum kahawae]|uniref:Uncharacterized protein n=1 Tax=Colletotrichum kahawae TaxID=34407 RepID=A0AAD9Y4F6_COLKA|nr:hypothetical protein CKAH01_01864 [Colletotrichum kahawae]